jgi:hypothetical protein
MNRGFLMSAEVRDEYGPAGAIPPTDGVAPEDAAPAHPGPRERSAADDLVDGVDLLLRAARKAAGSVDPMIEKAAEQALQRLQTLDAGMTREFERHTGSAGPRLEQVAKEAGKEIADLVRRVSERIEASIKR